MTSLLDLMSDEEKKKAIQKGEKRLAKKQGADISPEMYATAEFGYYFGWEGIVAIKRGYIEKVDDDGNTVREPFTLEEVLALLDASKKVYYSKVIESSHGNMVANSAIYAKNPGDAFKKGMAPFMEKAS